jgi:hypothetical protein
MNIKKDKKKECIDIWISICVNNKYTKIGISNFIKQKKKLNKEELNKIINYPHNDKTGKYKDFMFQVISNCVGFDNLDEEIIKHMSGNLQFNLVLNKLIELKQNIPDDCFIIAIISNNYELLELMMDKLCIKCTDAHLEIACKYGDIKIISHILQQKVIPTKKCVESIIQKNAKNKSDSYWGFNKYKYNGFFGVSYERIKIHELNNISKLKILCDYGYVIKQDDFTNMIKNRIYIKNYEKYNVKLTNEIKNICNEIIFYPYEETKMSLDGYKQLLKYKVNLSDLKKIEKHFDIKPNLECLKIACENKYLSTSIISHLLDTHLIVPDLECLGIAIKKGAISVIQAIYEEMENTIPKKKAKEFEGDLVDFDSDSNFDTKLKVKPTKSKKKIFSDSDSDSDYEEEKHTDVSRVLNYCYTSNDESSDYDEEEKPKLKQPRKKIAKRVADNYDSDDSDD